ncbi:MAG: hypothetical protein IPG96_09540 [Proteobacteria bacterium]|nr:hypothetical protein [Pseudomonadota bacterium]
MHRSRFNTPRLRATVALSGLSLLAAACGGKDAADLDPVEQQLRSLERALPEKRGDRLAGLCLDYASVCERAAGICLSIAESEALDQRCQAINTRCERTLARYCAGRPVRRDAGPMADAAHRLDAGFYRDASDVADSGRPNKDASVRPDRGWPTDAGGGRPTCSVSASPLVGDQHTPFSVGWISNGMFCRASVNDEDLGPISCTGSKHGLMLPPAAGVGLPPAEYVFRLVATQRDGTSTVCQSETIRVHYRPPVPPPCSVTVTPYEGDTSTDFFLHATADPDFDAACFWHLDGAPLASGHCGASGPYRFAAGRHTIMLSVLSPSSVRECHQDVVVVPAPAPRARAR